MTFASFELESWSLNKKAGLMVDFNFQQVMTTNKEIIQVYFRNSKGIRGTARRLGVSKVRVGICVSRQLNKKQTKEQTKKQTKKRQPWR